VSEECCTGHLSDGSVARRRALHSCLFLPLGMKIRGEPALNLAKPAAGRPAALPLYHSLDIRGVDCRSPNCECSVCTLADGRDDGYGMAQG
jgi:hypothetical protein